MHMAVDEEQPVERTRAQTVADRGRMFMKKLGGDNPGELPEEPPIPNHSSSQPVQDGDQNESESEANESADA